MRSLLAVLVVGLVTPLAAGCAHTAQSTREDRLVVAVDANQAAQASTTEVTEAPPMIVSEPVAARPRLSRTLTLGEGSTDSVYVGAPMQQGGSQAGQGGPNVVVNNNITINGSAPVVYGGYGGYGGRTYSGGGNRGSDARPPTQQGAWAPNGWEGAGRTAAPGQTPHVGGNWAPPPSHGPRQFK